VFLIGAQSGDMVAVTPRGATGARPVSQAAASVATM
jgi:hypothetical protein